MKQDIWTREHREPLKTGDPWMCTTWVADPPDGVLCLVSTRRTLDAHGDVVDYARCQFAITINGQRGRCLLNPGHDVGEHSTDHHTSRFGTISKKTIGDPA